jgi:hypothetical protein
VTIHYFQRNTARRLMTRAESDWCDIALKNLALAGLVRDVRTHNGDETSTMDREPGQSQKKER